MSKDKRPLLELVMIVKDSGEDIKPMLNSVKNFIDRWTILDTGSSDNTMEHIKNILKDIKGNLYDGKELYPEDPFVDFSTARNRALDLAGERCIYTIMLDDTYHLQQGKDLRLALKRKIKSSKQGFIITIKDDNKLYSSIRILKTKAKLRYHLSIHETVKIDDKLLGIIDRGIIKDEQSGYMSARSKSRYKSDILLMLNELEKNPKNRRLLYHLGKTYCCCEMYKKSREIFNKIINEKIIDDYEFEAYWLIIAMDSSEGKSIYKNYKLLEKLCENYPNRVEPLYYLAWKYLKENNITKSLNYIIKAGSVEHNSSIGVNYKLYTCEIPYLTADIAIKAKRYKLAEKVLKKYAPINNDTRLYNMVYSISNLPQPKGIDIGPTIVFHATTNVRGWNPNNLKSLDPSSQNCSGSEIMTINLSKSLAKLGFRVFVFGSFKSENYNTQGMFDNVQYIDNEMYWNFLMKYKVDILIVSRDVRNLVYINNVKKVYLWIHDVIPFYSGFTGALTIQYHEKKFKKILCLCNWHKNNLSRIFSIPKNNIEVTRNALLVNRFKRNVKKIPYRFIYASSIDRGLEHLLEMIPYIKEEFPETELHIFVSFKHNSKGNSKLLKNMISKLPYVFLRNRVTQDEIAHELLISDIWLYPTDFKETYCITALEAQAAGLLCACTHIGALSEIVGDRGIIVEGDINEKSVKKELINKVINILKNPEEKNKLTKKARKWALNQGFDELAQEWKNNFFTL